jgi:hypothetical protein
MRAIRCVWVGLVLLGVGSSAARAEAPPAAAPAPRAGPTAAPPPVAVAPEVAPGVAPGRAPAVAPRTAPAARPKTFPRLAQPTMSHYLQFGIALLPGTGYRGIFPYQEMINCGQPQKRVCTSRLPTFLDVQPSFGFGHHWDIIVDLRLGLGQDFTGSHQLAVAPGVRYWVDPDEAAKFFATVQVAYDATAQHDPLLHHNDDVALRNSNGFMFEVMRNFGVYLQFGETIGFVRWLRFEIDAGVGVQARLP